MYAWSGARGTRRTARESEARAAARAVRLLCLGLLLPLLSAMTVLTVRLGPDGLMLGLAYPAYALLRQAEPLPETVETLAPRSPEPLSVSAQAKAGSSVSPAGQAELPDAAAPRILIYHTHATEAYRQTPDSVYEESGAWRTANNEKNVVAVGERLASQLRDTYGLSVIHDATNHEPPKLSTSYSRSVETMRAYQKQYPSVTMYIDVHRDAYGSDAGKTDYLLIDGKETARVMFVVGTGEGATGGGFDEMPDFESNYALAAAVSAKLQAVDPLLARDIRVKTGRYNQHVSSQCLLAEMGHNMNTLEQAMNAADLLAAAIADVAGAKKVPARADWVP